MPCNLDSGFSFQCGHSQPSGILADILEAVVRFCFQHISEESSIIKNKINHKIPHNLNCVAKKKNYSLNPLNWPVEVLVFQLIFT